MMQISFRQGGAKLMYFALVVPFELPMCSIVIVFVFSSLISHLCQWLLLFMCICWVVGLSFMVIT